MGKSRLEGAFDAGWIVGPRSWGAAVDYDSWDDVWVPKDRVVVHHGGGPNFAGSVNADTAQQIEDEKEQLRRWEAYHLSKGHRGLDYCYAVGQSGTAYRARGWNQNGAQWGSDDVDGDGIGDNKESLPVVLIIGSGQAMTDEMKAGFLRLHDHLGERAGFDRTSLSYHQEVAASGPANEFTACPGSERISWVRELRQGLEAAKPTPEVLRHFYEAGIALGAPNFVEYWNGIPAGDPEWAYFVDSFKGGYLRWYEQAGLLPAPWEEVVTWPNDDVRWSEVWRAIGTTVPERKN